MEYYNRTGAYTMKVLTRQNTRAILEHIFYAALEGLSPKKILQGYSDYIKMIYKERNCNSLYILGFGKASCQLHTAIEPDLRGLITGGVIITKYGHKNDLDDCLPYTKIFEAGHPDPDENGILGANEILSIAEKADSRSLVVCLLSGGGSSLFVKPYSGVTLRDKQMISSQLMKKGADIDELNTVRKHLSDVKGGRLAMRLSKAGTIALTISDVIGDSPDVIASGPLSPDTTTYSDSYNIIKKYGIENTLSENVKNLLDRGIKGFLPDTPKPGDRAFDNIENFIIANNRSAVEAAKKAAINMGCDVIVEDAAIRGEAVVAAKGLALKAKTIKRNLSGNRAVCMLSGGETTVIVKGNGRGGRNMEFALAFAKEIDGEKDISLLSAGTDGTDGPTDSAGAVVDGSTIEKAEREGLRSDDFLRRNDSYTFFEKAGGLLITGPTGTNVMDLQIVFIGRQIS